MGQSDDLMRRLEQFIDEAGQQYRSSGCQLDMVAWGEQLVLEGHELKKAMEKAKEQLVQVLQYSGIDLQAFAIEIEMVML